MIRRRGGSTAAWAQDARFLAPVAIATMLLATTMPAASVPLSSAESEDIEGAYAAAWRQMYGVWLARTGSTLTQGSPAWEDSLHRTVTAILAGRPVDCALALWVVSGCGQHTYDVPAKSMLPAILDRDLVLSLSPSPAQPLCRGDIVAYRTPSSPEGHIHRILGLPGDRIRLVGGAVLLDGRPLDRVLTGRTVPSEGGSAALTEYRERLPDGKTYAVLWPNHDLADVHGANMADVTVPPDHYFVMGDNRSLSLDSRPPDGHGMPSAADIMGVVRSVIVSRDPSRIGIAP